MPRTISITSKASLVDGTVINWSVESAPAKTNITVVPTQYSLKIINFVYGNNQMLRK